MRCPWFWQRCGLKLSGGLRGAADVSNRCATSSIAQQCGCLARLAKFGLALLVSYRSLARQGPTTCVRILPSLIRLPVPVYASLLLLAAAFVKLPASVNCGHSERREAPRRRREPNRDLSLRRQTRLAQALRRAPPQTPKLLLHLDQWLSPRGASRASPAPRPEETKRLPRQHAASRQNRRKKNPSRRRAGAASPTRTAFLLTCMESRTGAESTLSKEVIGTEQKTSCGWVPTGSSRR